MKTKSTIKLFNMVKRIMRRENVPKISKDMASKLCDHNKQKAEMFRLSNTLVATASTSTLLSSKNTVSSSKSQIASHAYIVFFDPKRCETVNRKTQTLLIVSRL